jgi:hypothetical protein
MKCPCLYSGALVAVLAFAAPLLAQPVTLPGGVISPTAPIFLQQIFTTGMVGFTTNQTARLNVVNLNPAPASTATLLNPNCTVELQFYDNAGTLVKQSVVPNFAPGTATSFDLPRASVTSETAARAEIRGVVVVNPSPSPVESPATVGFCSVMTTLEVYDAAGSTVSSTSDTRAVGLLTGGITIAVPSTGIQ